MTGIEKLIDKILADARGDADAVLERAEESCREIRQANAAHVAAEEEKLREGAAKECESLITRARSSAAMAKRNAMLEARAALVREAYATAEKEIRNLTADAYLDLLVTMLKGALKRQLRSEQESMELYGEDVAPDVYEIRLNRRDREQFGQALLDTIKRTQVGKISMNVLDKLTLSNQDARIDGGLVLKCGDVEANCSLSMLFAEVRRNTEVKVSETLFQKQDRA